MGIDPRHAQWQLAGATMLTIGASSTLALVVGALTNPKLNLLANQPVGWTFVALDALTVFGLYALLGPIWNLPMPGPRPEVKHRSPWWLFAPLCVWLAASYMTLRVCGVFHGPTTVPPLSEIIGAVPWWPAFAAFLVVVLALYGVLAYKIASRVSTVNTAVPGSTASAVKPPATLTRSAGEPSSSGFGTSQPLTSIQRAQKHVSDSLSAMSLGQRQPHPEPVAQIKTVSAPKPSSPNPEPLAEVAPKKPTPDSVLQFSIDVDEYLDFRDAIDRRKVKGSPESAFTGFSSVLGDTFFDRETAKGYFTRSFHLRAKVLFDAAVKGGRERDAATDSLVVDGPRRVSDIRAIVRYLKYLAGERW